MESAAFESLNARATRHAEAGDWAAARADWLEALAIEPGSIAVMLEISYVESLSGRYRSARDWVLRAARAEGGSVDDAVALLQRLRTFNEAAAVREIAKRLLADAHAPHAVLAECGRQLSTLNDAGLALRCAKAALAKAPADLDARLLRGQLLADHGRIEEAAADIEWTLSRNPAFPTAWWKLSRLRKQTRGANHVAALRGLLRTPGLRAADAAALARALHKELDDIGEHEAAWQALELMCRAMRSTLRYDASETRALVDALIAWSPAPEGAAPPGDAGTRIPVFIVGMHRSGTTLLEQMLDASPQVRGIGELYDFTSEMRYATDHHCRIPIDATIVERAGGVDFADAGRRYLDGVAWRLGAESHFTDKQPANFFNVGFIRSALPQAKILHLVRDPVETCFSNLRELFSDVNRHSYDQADLADYFLQYRRLMAHWHALYPGAILDVEYARLTADPEPVMREVAAFCGIEYVEGMRSTGSSKRAVSTASAIQVREEVAARKVPKWAPYAEHLRPLREALHRGGAGIADPSAPVPGRG